MTPDATDPPADPPAGSPADPLAPLRALEAGARLSHTPCGEGGLAWRRWGEAGPWLVLLHGGAGSWRHWARNVPTLSRRFRLLLPDIPGFGDSALPPDPPGGPEGLVRALDEGLAAQLPAGEAVHLVGFSFGALVAAEWAPRLDAAGRLRSLVLVGAGRLGGARPNIVMEKVRNRTGAERVAAHRENLLRLMLAEPASVDALALGIQEENTAAARLNSRAVLGTGMIAAAIARTAAPVHAIWGERDAAGGGPEGVRERAGVLRGLRPDARVRLIPGAGHWVAFEAPAAFEAALLELIGEG